MSENSENRDNVDELEEANESSQKLLNRFSKRILYQFSKEKYTIENELRAHFDEEVKIKKVTLEKEYELKKESLENQLKMEFEQRWKKKEIENEGRLKEYEQGIVKETLKRSESIDEKWKEEIEKLKVRFEEEMMKKDEEYRKKELTRQKEDFSQSQHRQEKYEEIVKGNYEKLMKQYQEEVNKILESAEEENEKIRLELKQQKADYEMSVKKKFQALLDQKEKDMRVLLTDRENQLLNYDHQKNKKLIQQLQEKEKVRLENEKLLQGRYEEQLSEIKEISRQQIDTLLKQIDVFKKEKMQQQKEMNKMELKFREIQHNMDMWKLEYHKSTMEKFQKLLFEIELNSKKEMESFARKQIQQYESHLLLELRQKDSELKEYEKKERDFKTQGHEQSQRQQSQRQQSQDMSSSSQQRHEGSGGEVVKKFKIRLLELWDVLKVPFDDRFKFVWNCHSFNNVTNETILYFKNEIQRLTEKLPIVEMVKRREFVKKKIKELFKSSKRGIDDNKVNELNKEMKRLSEMLMTSLPNYENRWNEVFTVDGKQSYLKRMNQEFSLTVFKNQ